MQARKGTGAWKTLGTATATAKGVVAKTLSSTWFTNFLSTGVAKNGTVTMKANCGGIEATKQVKYLG